MTFAVLLLFPIGAWAASNTAVFVTDKATGRTAAVDTNRNLQTKVNGTVETHPSGTQSITGSVNATVSGAVTATPTPPDAMFHAGAGGNVNTCLALVTPPTGEATVITSIHITAGVGISGSVGIYTDGACTIGKVYGATVSSTDGETDFDFESGLPIANGDHLYVDLIEAGGSPDVRAFSFGYNVPAAQCSTGCL